MGFNIFFLAYITGSITLIVFRIHEAWGTFRDKLRALEVYATANRLPRVRTGGRLWVGGARGQGEGGALRDELRALEVYATANCLPRMGRLLGAGICWGAGVGGGWGGGREGRSGTGCPPLRCT
jgi:hypothetical protein